MVLASVALVYLAYWLYSRRNGLAEFSAQSEALQLVGEALMEEKVGQQKSMRSRWLALEAQTCAASGPVRRCDPNAGGSAWWLAILKGLIGKKAVDLARHIAQGLGSRCQHVDAVKEKPRSSAGMRPPAYHSKIEADLGCNLRTLTYRLRVQVRASSLIQNADGTGPYGNRHT